MKHNIEDFPKHSFRNKSLIKPDEKVSCYYCRTTYLGKYIEYYTGDDTAICPCGIDSVLPYEVDHETLKLASEKYFGAQFKNYKELIKDIPNINFIEGE